MNAIYFVRFQMHFFAFNAGWFVFILMFLPPLRPCSWRSPMGDTRQPPRLLCFLSSRTLASDAHYSSRRLTCPNKRLTLSFEPDADDLASLLRRLSYQPQDITIWLRPLTQVSEASSVDTGVLLYAKLKVYLSAESIVDAQFTHIRR